MLAINYTTMRNNLKEYCDRATDEGETIIVTRKADRNVVILSLEQYNQMEKELRNSRYLEKLIELSTNFMPVRDKYMN